MDDDIVYVMKKCKAAGVTVHVRGTDERPVVEFREKSSGKVVGGKEIKHRLQNDRHQRPSE